MPTNNNTHREDEMKFKITDKQKDWVDLVCNTLAFDYKIHHTNSKYVVSCYGLDMYTLERPDSKLEFWYNGPDFDGAFGGNSFEEALPVFIGEVCKIYTENMLKHAES